MFILKKDAVVVTVRLLNERVKRMEQAIYSETPISKNQLILRKLEEERAFLEAASKVVGGITLAGSIATNPLFLSPVLALLGFGLKKIQKLSQIIKVFTGILDNFDANYEFETLTQLGVPNHGSLDLLVKFQSPKVSFAIALRSQGKAVITYKADKDALYIRDKTRKHGGSRAWKPDHIQRFGEQEFWLRKNQNEVFGSSSKEKRRPLIKTLVLTGQTRLGEHPPEFYVNMGQERVLLLQKKVSIYIMEERQLMPFIRGLLLQKSQ